MTALIRKRLSLSPQNLSRLRNWADRYDLSGSELVRRAIQAYDPEQQPLLISRVQEKEAAALVNRIQSALKSALLAVEDSNVRIDDALASIGDPDQKKAIALEVEREIEENPGFLNEVAYLMTRSDRRTQ